MSATTELARNSGFLWVISLLSTLRRPLVTSPPMSANRPFVGPAGAAGLEAEAALDAEEEGSGEGELT